MGQQILGLIQVNWRGTDIKVEKGGKAKLGGLMQKAVITGQDVDFSAEYDASEITATTKLAKGTSLMAVWASGSGPLIITCDTGQTYSWPDAFLSNRPDFTAGDGGKVQLKWNAGTPVELVA